MKEKPLELKKTSIKQNIRKGVQEKYQTGGIDFDKRKTHTKGRTDTKNGIVRRRTKNQNDGE